MLEIIIKNNRKERRGICRARVKNRMEYNVTINLYDFAFLKMYDKTYDSVFFAKYVILLFVPNLCRHHPVVFPASKIAFRRFDLLSFVFGYRTTGRPVSMRERIPSWSFYQRPKHKL